MTKNFPKPFRTHQQQIKILRDRGLTIADDSVALRIFERENYYNVINGYKDLFLETDSHGNFLVPDTYKAGATIEDIHNLFCFDRELRHFMLRFILIFESNIKSTISYRFSEAFNEPHAYLIIENFTRDTKKIKQVLRLISTISKAISDKGSNSYNSPIKHYIDEHGAVPLWVLVNYLTMGNINNFYQCLGDDLKNTIANDFAKNFYRDYNQKIHFTPQMMETILKTANFLRNVCAHEERFFSYKVHKAGALNLIPKSLNIQENLLNNGDIFSLVAFLKLVIDKSEHTLLLDIMEQAFNSRSKNSRFISFDLIKNEMGFPANGIHLLR
ncbi:Abi family protein [Aureibacillus halotolerans]|uniref:Abortive infection bacteriophage resistance protein n=1 Tax=Aureibacillus halotolerans TaxID=1508390 RepID=A0A4R6TTZ8_9BACI|nr:Abi family protein [Aureibacillus halotolerans]TDQ37170.1 abortive infection bacteriophage resistance protein [Aureibacillus halotolerans]